jgi:hypothetical protein
MSQRIGNVVIIAVEAPATCELCGKADELRPYGPRGERICHECGTKDPAMTKKQMDIALFGAAPDA